MGTAIVTGGTQGVGKGIVEGLAEAGHTVFFTGRDTNRLRQTEEEASRLGGEVFARKVDHANDGQVIEFFNEVEKSYPLDLLVNNVWGGYERMVENGKFTFTDPFWEQPLWRWDAMINIGARAAFVASQLATRPMLKQSRGLIINISFWSSQKFTGNAIYGISKAATDKMTADMAVELRDKNIHVLALYPGLVRTEKVMANAEYMDLSNSESPRFIGRTVAALSHNRELTQELSGTVAIAADIAGKLGVTDIDGSSPRPLTLDDI